MDRTECKKVGGLLGPFLDGELDAASMVAVDDHLGECSTCRECVMLSRAMKTSLKRAVCNQAPEGLRQRLAAALAAERAREATEAADRYAAEATMTELPAISSSVTLPDADDVAGGSTLESQRQRWMNRGVVVARTWLPISAAAAALLFAWSTKRQNESQVIDARDTVARGLLGELVAQHSRPLPPERTEPSEVRAFERYVGVPVRLPFESSTRAKPRLVGGRIMPVKSERAAMLQYEVDRGGSARRVSVFIYDPARIHLDGENLDAVGASRVGRANGYTVAVTQHGGVGYALASDLDAEFTAELANNVE